MPIRAACDPRHDGRARMRGRGRRGGGRHWRAPAAMATGTSAPAAALRGRDDCGAGHRAAHRAPAPARRSPSAGPSDLVNQTVAVSWTGFRPSSATPAAEHRRLARRQHREPGPRLPVPRDRPGQLERLLRLARASAASTRPTTTAGRARRSRRSPTPARPTPSTPLPDGPANWQDNVTRADGTGEVTIQLFTKRESAGLGCDADGPVLDRRGARTTAGPQGATEDLLDAPVGVGAPHRRPARRSCPVDDACPLAGDVAARRGQPDGRRRCWPAGAASTCTLDTNAGDPRLHRRSASRRPAATWRPARPTSAWSSTRSTRTPPTGRGVVYAPVSVTGARGRVPDRRRRTGARSRRLKLNAAAGRQADHRVVPLRRRPGGDQQPGQPLPRPGVPRAEPGRRLAGRCAGQPPAAARRPLRHHRRADPLDRRRPGRRARSSPGKPDPWGMTVNANYKKVALPFASFPLLDEPLSDDLRSRSRAGRARPPAVDRAVPRRPRDRGGRGRTSSPSRRGRTPGAREVIGIIDAADAARFLLPTAVAAEHRRARSSRPTTASLLAGVTHATVNADGVTAGRRPDLARTPAIYPLTAAGLRRPLDPGRQGAARQQMADFLDYVAGPGQVPGRRGRTAARRARSPDRRRCVDAGAAQPATAVARRARPADRRPTPTPTDEPGDADRRPRSDPVGAAGAPTVGVTGAPPGDGAEPPGDRPVRPTPSAAPTRPGRRGPGR